MTVVNKHPTLPAAPTLLEAQERTTTSTHTADPPASPSADSAPHFSILAGGLGFALFEWNDVEVVPFICAVICHTCVTPQQPPREPQVPVTKFVCWELGGSEEPEGGRSKAGSASEGLCKADEGGSEGVHQGNGGYEAGEAVEGRGSEGSTESRQRRAQEAQGSGCRTQSPRAQHRTTTISRNPFKRKSGET